MIRFNYSTDTFHKKIHGMFVCKVHDELLFTFERMMQLHQRYSDIQTPTKKTPSARNFSTYAWQFNLFSPFCLLKIIWNV